MLYKEKIMKKILCMLLVCLLFLSGCIQIKEVSPQEVEDIIHTLVLDYHNMMISEVAYIEDQKIDRIIMYTFVPNVALIFHVVEGYDTEYVDYKIKITQDYIYYEQTMEKETHNYLISNIAQAQDIIENFVEWVDFSEIMQSYLLNLTSSMLNPSLETIRKQYSLFARLMTTENLPAGQAYSIEIVYENARVKEIHYRLQALFDSTKQQSNYISGRHYHFTQAFDLDFPNINLFS